MAGHKVSLSDRSLAAIKWNYIGVASRVVAQLIVQVALARLLGPDVLGLFALALLAVSLGNIVAEMGVGAALVQRRTLDGIDQQIAFTRALIASVCVALLVLVVSPSIAWALGDDRIAEVLYGMLPVFVLQALTVTSVSLLKRDLAFKAIQAVQISSYLVGFLVVGVGLALLGVGVWSLVAAWITQTAISAVAFYCLARHPTAFKLHRDGGSFTSFSFRVLITNLVNWLIENVDNLIVGKLFGTSATGLYAVSYNLVRTPANHLVTALQLVLFPATARAQDNQAVVQRAYLAALSGVAIAALPVFLGVAVVADTVVVALFGVEWLSAASVLMPLTIAMSFHALMAIAGPVLWGRGAAGTELKVQALTATFLLVILPLAGRESMVLMAWAVCLTYALRFIGITIALARNIRLPGRAVIGSVRGGVLVALGTCTALALADQSFAALRAAVRLCIDVAAAGSTLVLLLYFLPGVMLSRDLAAVVLRLLAHVRWANGWIARVRIAHPELPPMGGM